MDSSRSPSSTSGYTRRAVLAGAGSGALLLASGHAARAAESEVPRNVIIPTVSEFDDNYAGQFLTIFGPSTEEDISPGDIHEGCDVPWPEDATKTNLGQLSDRRSDTPVAVQLPVYVDSRQTNLVEDALFIINEATACSGDFVQLDTVWVTTRSLVGKPAGPTVEEADEGAQEAAGNTPGTTGDGFGILAGFSGVSGALLARYLRKSDTE